MNPLQGQRLVIFGCGYVGTAVARWALEAGLRVTALTRNRETAAELKSLGAEPVVADLATETWHDAIEGSPEFVLNCVSSGGGGIEAYRHSYVGGMQSILAWAKKRGPVQTVVYTSSTSVYPQGEGQCVDETMPTLTPTERAQCLLEAEARLSRSEGACGRWFVLRLAGIYGPGRLALLEQVRSGEVSGFPGHALNLIHRDDIVGLVVACLAAPATVRSDILNGVDDSRAQKAEIVTWLASKLGIAAPVFTGERADSRRAVAPNRIIVNTKAKTVLGWELRYPTFREGYGSLWSP